MINLDRGRLFRVSDFTGLHKSTSKKEAPFFAKNEKGATFWSSVFWKPCTAISRNRRLNSSDKQ